MSAVSQTTPAGEALLPRRALLAAAALGSTTVAVGACGAPGQGAPAAAGLQPGIADAPAPFMVLAGVDLTDRSVDALTRVLNTWKTRMKGLTGDVRVSIGLGPSLFDAAGPLDAALRPPGLHPVPTFDGDALDESLGHGDLCLYVGAPTPAAAADTARSLLRDARDVVRLRWRQVGSRDGAGADPRGIFGFRDGTANLAPDDLHDPALAGHLLADKGPSWLRGGTFLVVRRIRLLVEVWDRLSTAQQESVIGRRKGDNVRLPGAPGHAGLAAPGTNGGIRLLRRPYTYLGGVDPNGLEDSGLVLLVFTADPARFSAVQQRLSTADPLSAFSQHVGSAVFALPPVGRDGVRFDADLLGGAAG